MTRNGKLDSQNRAALPVSLLEEYANGETQLIMTFNAKYRCIEVWTPAKFREMYEKFEKNQAIDPVKKKAFLTSYINRCETVKIDSAKRVVIPCDLKKEAGIDREITFAGAGGFGKYFQIWDSKRYAPIKEEADRLAQECMDILTEL